MASRNAKAAIKFKKSTTCLQTLELDWNSLYDTMISLLIVACKNSIDVLSPILME
jgi:hypothetical protein